MIENNEKDFIARIKSALNKSDLDASSKSPRRFEDIFPNPPRNVVQSILTQIEHRDDAKRQALLNQLVEAGKPINLNVIAHKDSAAVATAIATLANQKKTEWGDRKQVAVCKHPAINALGLTEILAAQNITVHHTSFANTETKTDGRSRIRKQIIESFIGVTAADYCVADSATLVMKTRAGQARTVSLVPAIHIAVIYIDQILANLKELYALLKTDPEFSETGITNCLTFISGPSKTADIEATMVQGAHGPREVYLFVITGDHSVPQAEDKHRPHDVIT